MHGFTSLNTFIYTLTFLKVCMHRMHLPLNIHECTSLLSQETVRNEKLCETFSIQWTYSNIKFLKMNEPNIIILLSFFNHFIKIRLTYKRLYIFNLYNLMSLEISIHPCTITIIYAVNISITPRSFLPPSLFVDIILCYKSTT